MICQQTLRHFAVLFALLSVSRISAGLRGEGDDSTPASTSDNSTSIQVLYTGRLMGYFRVPNWESGNAPYKECSEWINEKPSWSDDAIKFDEQRSGARHAILVGTGDNFAPEIEARDFWPPPDPAPTTSTKLPQEPKLSAPPVGRDQYYWYPDPEEADASKSEIKGRWVSSSEATSLPNLLHAFEKGWGAIPSDNVGCFLIQEGYAAVVPGRHDFYFGPERLREIARFLASHYVPGKDPVQMLGANLVIETAWKNSHKPLADSEYKLAFVPHLPSKFRAGNNSYKEDACKGNTSSKDCDFPVLSNLPSDGKVYPWLPAVTFRLASLDHQLAHRFELAHGFEHKRFETKQDLWKVINQLLPEEKNQEALNKTIGSITQDNIYLCQSALPGDRNAISQVGSDCQLLSGPISKNSHVPCVGSMPDGPVPSPIPGTSECPTGQSPSPYFMIADDAVEYVLPLPPVPDDYFKTKSLREPETHFFNLKPGENYGLCIAGRNLPAIENIPNLKVTGYYCQRFSVYWPFFLFHPYADETDPHWVKPGQTTNSSLVRESLFHDPEPYVFLEKDNVAIFGIVDPAITEYVGALNLMWENKKKEYNTSVTINDPLEALREITGYFEQKYWKTKGTDFDGVKILLADMSPARAKAFAAHFRQFQIVVSAADDDLETAGAAETITRPRNATPKAFVAVPAGYYRVRTPAKPSVEIGKITFTTTAKAFTLQSERVDYGRSHGGSMQTDIFPSWFNDQVQQAAQKCFNSRTKSETEKLDMSRLQWLTLCAMQRELGADVALLQTRDFFGYWPNKQQSQINGPVIDDEHREESSRQAQLFLDRIIWKGDFLTLVYVPGSALLKALEQSEKYKSDDGSALSLSDEHQRDLIYAGIIQDKARNEYLINEAPLDKNRLYAVATSDYIAAGGTGYPDFAAAVIRPPQSPQDFPQRLQTISGLVCRKIYESWHPPKTGQSSSIGHYPVAERVRNFCRRRIDRDSYLDSIAMEPTDRGKGDTAAHEIHVLISPNPYYDVPQEGASSSVREGSTEGSKSQETVQESPANPPGQPTPDSPLSDADAAQRKVEYRGLGVMRINPPDPSLFAIDNASLSFTSLTHKFSDAQLKSIFPGNPLTQLTATRSHTLQFDARPIYTYSRHWAEFFELGEARFNDQYTGQPNASRIIDQKENLLSSDTGIAFHFWAPGLPPSRQKHYRFGRSVPHFEPTISLHYETQVLDPLPNFLESLATSNNVQVAPGFDKGRTHLLLARTGFRYLGRVAWVEGGLETGKEYNAIRLFTPPGSSLTTVLRPDIPVSGGYFNAHAIAPISKTVSWQIDEMGDYFFNKPTDNPVDTKFRSDIEMAINIKIWASLSLSPTYEIFAYTNKVQDIWFWQEQASLKLRARFDFWNHRDWWARQIRYSPSAN